MNNTQSELSLSQSDDDNYNDNHNEMDASKISMDTDTSKQLLLDKIAIYRMIHENKWNVGNLQRTYE